MIEIPGVNGEPTIKIFNELSELRSHCGEKLTHGFFDPQQNLIMATVASVAHEIGHYRDYRSGRIKNISEIKDSEERIRRRIRNEIVAILFSYQRVGDQYGLLHYERDFIEWAAFQWAQSPSFKEWTFKASHLSKLSFTHIQDLAEWLVQPDHSWKNQLQRIFGAYLKSETEIMTYGL